MTKKNATANATATQVLDAQIMETIRKMNDAIQKNDMNTYQELKKELDNREKSYAKAKAKEVYAELLSHEKPVVEACKMFDFVVISHKEEFEKETGKLQKVSRKEKSKQIDPLALCEQGQLDTSWQYRVQEFNQLMCLGVAKDLECTADELNKIANTYFMAKTCERIKKGETPTSNNKLGEALQICLNEMLAQDDENPEHKYVNKDLKFLKKIYTKKGKTALSVATANHKEMRMLLMRVAKRIIENARYETEYKALKQA